MAVRKMEPVATKERNPDPKKIQIGTPTPFEVWPPALFTDDIVRNQRMLGNQTLQKLYNIGIIKAKLKISAPNDPSEKEADQAADHIINDSEDTTQKKENTRDSSITHESAIHPDTGEGAPLPNKQKELFESSFKSDFSQVRVHTDKKAESLAQTLNAKAFTYGSDIYFAKGEYAPGDLPGKKLLAHELTHVVQRKNGLKDTLSRQEADKQEAFEGHFFLSGQHEIADENEKALVMELAIKLNDEDASLVDIIALRLELASAKRKTFLYSFFMMNHSIWLESGDTAETVAAKIEAAYMDEEACIALLAEASGDKNPIPELVSSVLLSESELFPRYTVGLYKEAVEEFGTLKEKHETTYQSALADILSKPVEDIIPGFIWMMKNKDDLEWEVHEIQFLNWLDEQTPLFLEKKEPNSTKIGIDKIKVKLNEHITAFSKYAIPGEGKKTFGFIYDALEEYYFYALYKRLEKQMDLFLISVEVSFTRLNRGNEPADVVKDLKRTYALSAPQVPSEYIEEGFNDIYYKINSKLDKWVAKMSWDERIIEGFGLYDIIGELKTQLKLMVTPEAIAMMAGFTAFIIGLQFVPYANIVVDAILLALGGLDLLGAIMIFSNYSDAASKATNFIKLYYAAQKLHGGGMAALNAILSLIGLAAGKSIKAYTKYKDIKKLKSLDEIADFDVIKKGQPEVKAAFKEAQILVKGWARLDDASQAWIAGLGDDVLKAAKKSLPHSKDDIIGAINSFHNKSGFDKVLKDYILGSKAHKDGARFVMRYAFMHFKESKAIAFEMAKMPKFGGGFSRFVDVYADGFFYEFKSVKKVYAYLVKGKGGKLGQMPKDIASLISSDMERMKELRWVFNSEKGLKKTDIIKEMEILLESDFLLQGHPLLKNVIALLDEIIVVWP